MKARRLGAGLLGVGLLVPAAAACAQSAAPAADRAYDARLLASATAAERFRGPLDGGWVLSAAGGDLYAFELADHGGQVEGAWRDLHRQGADASGILEPAARSSAGVTLRFSPAGAAPVTVVLGPDLRGRAEQDGRTRAVRLRRRRSLR